MSLKMWTEVYPQGTKEGDEEQKFFISLSRKPQWTWRSVGALVEETKLSKERVEEIIEKYEKLGMIFRNPSKEDQWGYWQRVPKSFLQKKEKSLSNKDHKERIKKVMEKDN